MANFKRVSTGDRLRIPAKTFNAMQDAAIAHQARSFDQRVDSSTAPREGITILIKNASGADVAQFGVLGLDEPVIAAADNLPEFKQRVVMKGLTPVIATHTGRFAVLAEPIKNGAMGRGFIAGIVPARLEVVSESDAWADVKASSAELKSGSQGAAQILHKQSGTGSGKWAILRYPMGGTGDQWRRVRITSAATPGTYYGLLTDTLSTAFSEAGAFDDENIATDTTTLVRVINLSERAQGTNALTVTGAVPHHFWVRAVGRNDDDGYPIYEGNLFTWKGCGFSP